MGQSATDVLALLGRRESASGSADDRVDPLHYGIETLSLIGQVDEHHRLTAEVPATVPAGPVKVLLAWKELIEVLLRRASTRSKGFSMR